MMQRQFEKLEGPVVHLLSVHGVQSTVGGKVYVRMWLADSSGVHTGRHAVWAANEPHVELSGPRPTGW